LFLLEEDSIISQRLAALQSNTSKGGRQIEIWIDSFIH